MGQMLTLPRRSIQLPTGATKPSASVRQPGAAAQGILLAIMLSVPAWIGLGLLVPLFW
jgi:hypothetical protein